MFCVATKCRHPKTFANFYPQSDRLVLCTAKKISHTCLFLRVNCGNEALPHSVIPFSLWRRFVITFSSGKIVATEVAIQRNAVLSVATFVAAFSGKIMGTFRTHVAHYYAVFGYDLYPSVKCGNKLLPCRADATSIKKPAHSVRGSFCGNEAATTCRRIKKWKLKIL